MELCKVCKKIHKRNSQFCSTACFNKGTKVKEISGYRQCFLCAFTFPYRNTLLKRGIGSVKSGGVAKKTQKFCSQKCSIEYRNKYENPASTLNGRRKISESAKKRDHSHLHTAEAREKQKQSISGSGHWNWQGGISHPKCIDCGNKLSHKKKRCTKCSGIFMRGENAPNWKGGLVPINKRLRKQKESKDWRKSIFKRDNWTCVLCGNRSSKNNPVELQADHIKPWAYYPSLRYEITNGRTLCLPCHKQTDTYMGKATQYAKRNGVI